MHECGSCGHNYKAGEGWIECPQCRAWELRPNNSKDNSKQAAANTK